MKRISDYILHSNVEYGKLEWYLVAKLCGLVIFLCLFMACRTQEEPQNDFSVEPSSISSSDNIKTPTSILSTVELATPTVTKEYNSKKHIYFYFPNLDANEIWKMDVDGSNSQMLYQAPPYKVTFFEVEQENLISTEAIQVIRDEYSSSDNSFDLGSELLDVQLMNLTLSPSKEFLAWMENYSWCPGNYCIGQQSIKILNLNTNEIDAQIDTVETFSALVWSSDSQYLAFNENTRSRFEEQEVKLWLFDNIGKDFSVIGEGSNPSWSPNNQDMVTVFACKDSNKLGLQKISVNGKVTQILSPEWGFLSNPSWSPNGKNIAFLGNGASDSEGLLLHLLNIQSSETVQLAKNKGEHNFLGLPRWSPDGRWIAVNARDTGTFVFHPVVLDSDTGEIILDTNESRVSLFQWGEFNKILAIDLTNETVFGEFAILDTISGIWDAVPLPESINKYAPRPDALPPLMEGTW